MHLVLVSLIWLFYKDSVNVVTLYSVPVHLLVGTLHKKRPVPILL